MITKKVAFIIAVFNFILGVAVVGVQAELKIQQLDESLNDYSLKIERCPGYVGVLPKNSRLKCGG